MEHGPKFNLGKTKSAILAIDIPAEEELDLANCRYMQLQVPVVQHYTYMGIAFDATLSMDSHLASTLARMNSRFEEHMACGINAGLPTPLLAAITDQGPEAVGFYGLALCIGAAGAESKLNAMQANWCREVLGCQGLPQGPHFPMLAECGATRRIGTRMLGAALMLEARIWSSDDKSPARLLLSAARDVTGDHWLNNVRQIRLRLVVFLPFLSGWKPPASFLSLPICVPRKHLLGRYKVHIVEPALSEYDNTVFLERTANSDWPYCIFQPRLEPLPRHLLLAQWSQYTWHDYKIWSLSRATGRFGWAPLGIHSAPKVLPRCPLCHCHDVTLLHLLKYCTPYTFAQTFVWY